MLCVDIDILPLSIAELHNMPFPLWAQGGSNWQNALIISTWQLKSLAVGNLYSCLPCLTDRWIRKNHWLAIKTPLLKVKSIEEQRNSILLFNKMFIYRYQCWNGEKLFDLFDFLFPEKFIFVRILKKLYTNPHKHSQSNELILPPPTALPLQIFFILVNDATIQLVA